MTGEVVIFDVYARRANAQNQINIIIGYPAYRRAIVINAFLYLARIDRFPELCMLNIHVIDTPRPTRKTFAWPVGVYYLMAALNYFANRVITAEG